RIEVLLALNQPSDANALITQAEAPTVGAPPIRDERRLAGLKARAALAAEAGGDLGLLAGKAATDPVDCEAKLAYARALAAKGDYEPALAELLTIVQTDQSFGDDIARRTMLTVFDGLPGGHSVFDLPTACARSDPRRGAGTAWPCALVRMATALWSRHGCRSHRLRAAR